MKMKNYGARLPPLCQKPHKIIEIIIHDEKIHSVNSDTLLNIFEVFEYCLIRKMVFLSTRKELIKILPHLLDDSKLALKKINRFPEIVSGIRLMQLLVKNTGFLLLDRYDEPIFRNSFISGEWSEEIERFMHLTSRYTKNNIYFLQTYEESNIYEMSLLNIIDRMPVLSRREREHVLEPFLTMESIEVLIETNPELLSRIVLSLLKNSDIRQKEMDSVIEVFLRGCLNHLEDIGIGYLEFNTIINSISIACYIDATWFLNEIRRVLHYQLFGRHPRFFMSIIYLYPKFVADLIDVMPEIFDKFFPNIFEPRFIEKEFRYAKPEKWLDYIKIFRCFYQLFYRESHKKEDIPRELHMFSQMILEFNKFREIDFAQLTISQIEDLMWYADFTDDEHISTRIKEALQRYLYIQQHLKVNFERLL